MSWNDPNVYEVCSEVLRSGGVVLHPTETCYGLAVDVMNERALDKLYLLKRMSKDKPVSILVADLAMAFEFGEFSPKALELARSYWPGPLSIVVPRKNLPEFVNPGEENVSLRCSSMEFCSRMVGAFGGAVSTTSANFTGEPQAYNVGDLGEDFLSQVDLVVDGGALPENLPSTIVKVFQGEVEVLRQGEVVLTEGELGR